MQHSNQRFLYQSSSMVLCISFDNIVYIEAEKHLLNIYTSDESKPYVIRNTLDQTMAGLPQDQFVRCHRGYIVNMKHIRSVRNNMISLNNSTAIIPVGRTWKEHFNTCLSQFYAQSIL